MAAPSAGTWPRGGCGGHSLSRAQVSGIQPCFVFDGALSGSKRDTRIKRMKRAGPTPDLLPRADPETGDISDGKAPAAPPAPVEETSVHAELQERIHYELVKADYFVLVALHVTEHQFAYLLAQAGGRSPLYVRGLRPRCPPLRQSG
mmetsp:Transcript_2933/g.8512  ORF Transcript_2933/g.8512 Transcript_2933/m.8512 type:complete len:147 (+) Transcript_2933:163-603(+)